MTNGEYVLVQKTVSKITDKTKTEELLVSDDIMDVLNRLMEELKIDHEHYCSIEMTDAKSFVSETFDRTYIYSIHFKRNPEAMDMRMMEVDNALKLADVFSNPFSSEAMWDHPMK